MASNAPSHAADTEVQPVNIHRLVEIFELLSADYVLVSAPNDSETDPETDTDADAAAAAPEDERIVLQTGLPHLTIHFDIQDDTLSAFATWEGRLDASAEETVAPIIADFNWQMVAPTLSYAFSDGQGKHPTEQIVINGNRAMAIGEGLSRNQLGTFILSVFGSFSAAFEAVAQAFPQAVTWNEED